MNQQNSSQARPKHTPRLLSTSLDREELIAAKICIACRGREANGVGLYCVTCAERIALADTRAYLGMFREMKHW